MKQLLKDIFPNSLIVLIAKIYARITYRNRPRFITWKYDTFSVLQCCIAYNKYGGYCVPLSSCHRPVAQKLFQGSIQEPKTIQFLISRCQEGDIVHAGTYFGDFLPALSRFCAPNSKIWAFEPNPENYKCARITLQINDLQNIELMNAGLGEHEEIFEMVTTDESGQALGGASRILKRDIDEIPRNTEIIQMVTLDKVIPSERKVSIIQLDVEGYEQQALSGALEIIQRCWPIIVLENLPEEQWLFENLLKYGYRIGEKIHNNTVLFPPHRSA